jgi:hypothetical protein
MSNLILSLKKLSISNRPNLMRRWVHWVASLYEGGEVLKWSTYWHVLKELLYNPEEERVVDTGPPGLSPS